MKPTRVKPLFSASCMASDVGADTAASSGMLALVVFATIS